MAVTSGFFNSINHDRLYNAEQMSSIFDGIINDGVFEHYGDAFEVTVNPDLNDSVIVGSGRAWFDHTWTLNDAPFSITLEPPSLATKRIDAIVIDVDRRDNVRRNSITHVTGVPSNTPEKPTMLNEERHKQYPVAYVTLEPGDSAIVQSKNIEYNVGKATCPLVTGPLEVVNSDAFFEQMNANFETFTDGLNEDFQIWFDGIKDLINDLEIGNINLVNSVDNITIEWPNKKLQVKDRGITRNKLSFDLQSIIGVLDPSDWGYQEYYEYVQSISDSGEEETFINRYLSSSEIAKWTADQVSNFYDILKSDNSKNTLWSGVNWNKYSLQDFYDLTVKFGSSKYSSMIGKTIHLNMNEYGAHDFRVIGVNHDNLTSGEKALFTFQSTDIVAQKQFIITRQEGARYAKSPMSKFVESLIESFDPDVSSMIKQVSKQTAGYSDPDDYNSDQVYIDSYKVWIMADTSLSYHVNDKYDYWESHYQDADRIMKFNSSPSSWLMRGIVGSGVSSRLYPTYQPAYNKEGERLIPSGSTGYRVVYDFTASPQINEANGLLGNTAGIVPCFCV